MKKLIRLLLLFCLQTHFAFASDIATRASLDDYMATIAAFFSEPVSHINETEHHLRSAFSSKIITEGKPEYYYDSLDGTAEFLICPDIYPYKLSEEDVDEIIHQTYHMKPFAKFYTTREILGDDMAGVIVKKSGTRNAKWEVFIHNVSSKDSSKKINLSTLNPDKSELNYTLFASSESSAPSITGKSLPPLLSRDHENCNLVLRVFRDDKFKTTINFFILSHSSSE